MRKSVQTEGAPQKKKHRCLTCLIVCLVLLVVLTAAIIGASAIVFNKMVSPMIGGVKFGQALSLLSGALHANEKKIVTDGYSEQDLDDFYAELNSKTYQTVKSDTQLEQEYNALPLEEQDAMTLTEYKEKNRYTITVGKILDAVGGIQDLIEGGNNTTGQPEEDTATAEDVEEGESGSSNPLADNEMLTKLLEQLNFDFSPLANYDYRSDVEDENQTTFRVTGKQVAALIGDVLREVLGSLDLSKYLEAVSSNADISTLDLTKYINIPQVTFEYTEQDPGETATEEQKQSYLKSVRLAVTLKMDFNGLLKAPEIKKLVETVAEEMIPIDMAGKGFVGKLALNAVRMFLPKKMFVTAAIYPLDADRDMEVKINNYSEKNQKAMTTIIDHFAVEDENGNKRDLFGTGVNDRGMMGQLNAYVVKAIDGIHDIVPLEFVDSKSGAQLKLAHIQMLLSLMGLYKADDLEHSITPHMFMTTLRCLLDAAEAQPIYGDLSALYQELEDKYGIDHTYWEERSLLDTEAMDDLVNQIDVTRITFNENELMKVNVYQDQLASLISDALQKGLLTGGETAAAGDEEESGSPNLLKLISFDSLEIASVDAQLDHTDFRMSAWASIDVAKLLGEFIKEESAIINSLTEALPKGLCFALSVYVRDTWDLEGNVHHTVGKIDLGDGAFVNETGICINKFDQYYTSRVLETIKLMISTLGGGEDSFDISTLSDTIEDAFRQVFEAIEDNLYCSIDLGEETVSGVKKGKMLLPSLYEVVRGLSIQQVNENASLSMDDVLSLGEIREVFRTLYNYQGSPEQYDADAADDFLSDLEAKYYLTEHWTVDDVMNGNVTDRIGADSIDFGALYQDTRPVSSLNVGITGDALADLIGRSGKLDDLDFGSGDDSVIKGIEMVNCGYSVEDGEVYLEFICRANLSASESAAAGDDSGLSIDKLLPRNIFVTGKTLINRAGGYHEDGVDDGLPVRFASSVLINDNARSVELISKLLKVFGDSSIETDTFTTNISDSMRDTFADIESNINLIYGTSESNALSLANIYNTINKNSHKDDDVYNAQSQAAKEADDQKLADLMREVGRNPEFETGTGDKEGIVTDLDVTTFSLGLVWGKSDEDAFFDAVNANFYIAQGHEITAAALDEGYEIDKDTVDFQALYGDVRDYDLLHTALTSKGFAALANAIFKDGIEVEGVGVAKILQVKINEESLDLLIQVHNTQTDDAAKIMPAYLYVTSSTSLIANGLGIKEYTTTCQINDLSNADTSDFIDRLNLLKSAFEFDFDLTMDTITKPIADSIKDLFDDKLDPFGTIEIVDGAINLPTVFGIINERSHEDDDPLADGYNNWTAEQKDLDDRRLCLEMREVGRNPEFETGTGDKEGIVTDLDVATFSLGLVWGKSDEDAFFAAINANFYIATGQEITAQSLNEDFEINNDTLDFHRLYADDRDYDLLRTSLTNKRFAALANALYTEGITVDDIGTAKILQVSISEESMQLLVQVHNTQTDDTSKVMPEYLYITSVTSLTSMELGVKTYETTCQINDLTYGNTGDFIDRINLLKTAFDLDFNLSMDTITKPIADNIKDLFEEKMEPFGTIQIEEGAINLPTIFGIINERSHKNDDPMADGYNNWTAAAKDADDQVLCTEMREMGRNPAFKTGTGDREGVVIELGVSTFDEGRIYGKSDETAFFNAINDNFYIATDHKITAQALNENFEINSTTLDFHALYADTDPYADLHTELNNKHFAALANALYTDGITVTDIGTAKILQVSIKADGAAKSIQLLVQVHVTATGDTEKVLPEYMYVTSVTSLVDGAGYATTCQINNMDIVAEDGTTDFIDYRLGLIKAAFELEFSVSTATITDPIADNIRELFEDKLEPFGTIKIEEGKIILPTIFGIINERSHKNDDPMADGYNNWTAAAKDADDQVLCAEMREMGRNPIPGYKDGADSDIVKKLAVQTFSSDFVYSHLDETAFFGDVNTNFYIADGKEITAAKINDQNFTIGNDVVDFRKLYADTREYEDMNTVINNKRFAALANALYTTGIEVTDIGVAKILQVSISADSLQLLVQVRVTAEGDTANVLPECMYVTSVTSLVPADGYATTCQINDMDIVAPDGTSDFIDYRLGLIKTAFDLEFSVSTATITEPIADNIQDLFENKINTFGNVVIENGKIILPTVFSFLVDGSYADKEVQSDYVMYAMDEDGYCYLSDQEVYLDGSDWRYVESDALYAGDPSTIVFFNNQGVKHYFPQEGRVDRVEEMIDDGHGNMVTTHVLYLSGTANEVNADSVLKQDPEILMYSLREFGKADSVDQYANNIYIWKDHAPSTLNDKYNTNLASEDEETAFYQRLQGFYFFQETPDNTWFDSSSNIFDRLTGSNFESSFNLNGSTDTRTYSTLIEASEIVALEAHYSAGLYHYLGDRKQVLMTDRAMGALVNKQNVLAGSGLPDNIQTMTVTAFEISVDPVDAKIMTIEITTEVIAKDKDSEHAEQSGEALPTKFYITTTTVRNDNLTGSARYSTGVSINGMQPKDVKRMLNNIGVLSSFDLSSQLDLDKIAKNVEDALKELLDQKLDKYVDGYEDGGMLFHSVYRQVVNNLNYDITQYSYDEATAEEDVQQIIVKLHNVTAETSFNEQSSAHQTEYDTANIIPQWIRTTDKAFGNSLSQMIEADPAMGDYIDIKQAVFFTGDYSARTWDSTHWEYWEDMIEQRSTGFAFGSGTYIAVSAKVNINFDSNVKFVPGSIHVTLVIDESKHGSANPLLFDDVIINDLTAREQLLLMSSITDNGGKLTSAKADMIAKIQQAFATLYVAGYNISYEQANSAQDWVGVLVATKQ